MLKARRINDIPRLGFSSEVEGLSSKPWPNWRSSSAPELRAAGVGGMNLIAGGSGGARGFLSGESISSMECIGCGGVTGPMKVVPLAVGRCVVSIALILGGEGSDDALCCTTRTDLFWWGNIDTAMASETSAVVPAVSYDACENGVTCVESRFPKKGSPLWSTFRGEHRLSLPLLLVTDDFALAQGLLLSFALGSCCEP